MKHGFWVLELLPELGSNFAKKWEVTFKKSDSKIVVFWCLDLLNLDGKMEAKIRSKHII